MKIEIFLKNLGIHAHPGLRIDRRLTGYQNFTFGCRVAFSRANVRDLAHELAHAAQFGPSAFETRALEHGFAFRTRFKYWNGQGYADPRTARSTLRELETFAYGAHLLQLAGERLDLDRYFSEAARLMTKFMPDWAMVPGDTEKARKAWCKKQAFHYYERRKAATVQRRLIAWLDLTAEKLKEVSNPA